MASLASQRAWVEVDLDAIRHNLRNLAACVAPGRFLAVVKSEAYGHGLLPIARVALQEGAWGLAVVTIGEALVLREAGIAGPIVVVGPVFPFELEEAVRADISIPVYSLEIADAVSATAIALKRTAKVHIKLDTGLSRLAVPVGAARPFLESVSRLPGLDIEGVYSHYADAEGLDQTYTLRQFRRFREGLALCQELGIRPRVRHISASAAGMLLADARLDLVRTGIAMYGLWPAEETRILMASRGQDLLSSVNELFAGDQARPIDDFLRPALTYKTLVAQVKTLAAGTHVGYGCTYETSRETRVAILPVGYAEGYDRHLSNVGEVLVRGRRARVLGRICMNMTTVDVSDIPGVEMGDQAVLIGRQGEARISAEEVARKVGSINYEIVTRIPATIPRIYRGLA